MIPKSYGMPNEFYKLFEPTEAKRLKNFIDEVNYKFRNMIIETEKDNPESDPIPLVFLMNIEIRNK